MPGLPRDGELEEKEMTPFGILLVPAPEHQELLAESVGGARGPRAWHCGPFGWLAGAALNAYCEEFRAEHGDPGACALVLAWNHNPVDIGCSWLDLYRGMRPDDEAFHVVDIALHMDDYRDVLEGDTLDDVLKPLSEIGRVVFVDKDGKELKPRSPHEDSTQEPK